MGKWEVSETSHFFRAATLKKHGSGSCIIRKYGIAGIPWGVLLCRESISQTCILGICDFLGISIYFDENMLSHSAAGKNVCIESVDENNKI